MYAFMRFLICATIVENLLTNPVNLRRNLHYTLEEFENKFSLLLFLSLALEWAQNNTVMFLFLSYSVVYPLIYLWRMKDIFITK